MYRIGTEPLGQVQVAPRFSLKERMRTAHMAVPPQPIPPERVAQIRAIAAARAEAARGAVVADEGLPAWAWALIGISGALAVGGVVYVLRKRRAAKEP